MKRFLALCLALIMILSLAALAGCGENKEPAADTGATTADAATEAEEETEEPVAPVGPLTPTAFTAAAGSYELTFEPIDLGGISAGSSSSDLAGTFYDGKYYITDKGAKKVYVFAIDGAAATLENTYDFEKGFEAVSVNKNGEIIFSQGIFEAYKLVDGAFTELPYKHDIKCSRTEDFAVTTWVNSDPTIIIGGEETDWVFKNINDDNERVGNLVSVFDCEVAGDRVLIGGYYKENEEDYRIGVYDFEGNELAITAEGEDVGYVALNETANGIISANVDKLYLFDSECKPLGKIDDLRQAAGFDSATVSPFWVREFNPGDNGEVYMLVYAKKADDTSEVLLYKVTGF